MPRGSDLRTSDDVIDVRSVRRSTGDERIKSRGQAVVEFALILPIMLALLGAGIDVARLYQAWNVLESATRDAAEYAATNDTTSAGATTSARRIVCAATGSGPSCVNPTVSVAAFSSSLTAAGASTNHPVVTATVATTMPFRTLFPYPLITQNGDWILSSSHTFAVVQGR